MASLYVATKNFSLTTSTTVLLELATPAGVRAKLTKWWVEFQGTTASNSPVNIQIARATVSATGTALTPVKYDDYAPTANVTAEYGATAGGTVGDILEEHMISPTAGLIMDYPLGREISIPVSSFLWIRALTPGNAVTAVYGAVWEE